MFSWIELPWTRIRITGRDRIQVLHNFCTADVRRMNTGDCREAFVLNLKGKLLGHAWLIHWGDWLELITVPKQAPSLIAHFQQFVIREQVEFHDVSSHAQTLFLFHPEPNQPIPGRSNDALLTTTPPFLSNGLSLIAPDRAVHLDWNSQSVPVVHAEFAGPGWLLGLPLESADRMRQELLTHKFQAASKSDLDAYRIIYRTPWYNIDADQDCLPQELDRDTQAISFDKGCYLGQETVARIDALGKVNRRLVRVKTNQPEQSIQPDVQNSILAPPSIPLILNSNGIEVGRLTSIAPRPDGAELIGLAMVKRAVIKSGTELTGGGLSWQVW